MSWFTQTIRDPLENAITGGGATPSANPPATPAAKAPSQTSSWIMPLVIAGIVVTVLMFAKKG